MATKTFEELKQLAIQIRDEKTNKQNTATRIGTQMLEHLNKLEQDYYDKTATDEELKQRDEKLSELSSKTDKIFYHSVYEDDSVQNDIKKKVNRAIKELYLKTEISSVGTISLGNVRRNYTSPSGSGQWNVTLYDSSKSINTVLVAFTSVNKKGALELLEKNGCYCLIDWSEVEDGVQIVGSTSSEYQINVDYVSDINNFPVIRNYIISFSNQEIITNIEPKAYKIFYHSIYSGSNDNIIKANKAIKELWLCEYTASVNTVSLGLIRKNYGESHQWAIALYDNSNQEEIITIESFVSNNNTQANENAGIELINGNKGSYILIDWSEYEDGSWINSRSTEYQLNIPYVSDINNFPIISLNTRNNNFDIINWYVERYNKPAISWVDDDFKLTSVPNIKAICDEVGCKCDFALVPQSTGGMNLDYDAVYSISEDALSLAKSYELEGFHIEMHPPHFGWYASESMGGDYSGRKWVENSLVKTIRIFKEKGLLNSSCIIYPGVSGKNAEAIDMASCHVEFGVNAGSSSNYNNGVHNKFSLDRLFISFTSSHTKTWYKGIIDEAVEKGAWLILGTHGHEFSDSDILDETTKSLANLKEVIQYANEKCAISPISQIFRKREPMLNLFVESAP